MNEYITPVINLTHVCNGSLSTVNAYAVTLSASRRVLEHTRSNQQPRQGATGWEINGGENERGAAGLDRQLKSNIVGYPESDDEDNSNVREVENLPTDLQEIRQQLNYLKNEFSQVRETGHGFFFFFFFFWWLKSD